MEFLDDVMGNLRRMKIKRKRLLEIEKNGRIFSHIRFKSFPVFIINNVFTGYQPGRFLLKTLAFV